MGEARGRQEIYTRQAPQKLKILREHALIESAVSSNRIEGVTVEQRSIKAVVPGKELLHDRNEEEVRGYRRALHLILTLASLEQKCAHASRDMVRRVLRDLQKAGKAECLGRGPGASWQVKRG